MRVFLVDGTYELFRHHFGIPEPERSESETGGVRGVLGSVLSIIEDGATHLGVATDHVIESFRNDMWPTYKSSAGVPRELLAQFPVLELALQAMGVVVWPMVELEADDALASAAAVCEDDPAVDQVVICTPDKDLAQCVRDGRVVQVDRRRNFVFDEQAIVQKFGVPPSSIADYLALVGDSSDGYPGLKGWGPKSAAAVLARWGHIENIPVEPAWDVTVRGMSGLASTLVQQREQALLFKDLATLRIDRSLLARADDLRWHGPTGDFEAVCDRIGAPHLAIRARHAAERAASRS